MAVTVPDKSMHIECMTNSLRSFVLECGRTNGILQSDNEPALKSVIDATAAKIDNMTTRTAPNYSRTAKVQWKDSTVRSFGKSKPYVTNCTPTR